MWLRCGTIWPHLPASCSWSVAPIMVKGQLKSTLVEHPDGRPAPAVSPLRLRAYHRWPVRKQTGCAQIIQQYTHHSLKRPSWRSATRCGTNNLQVALAHSASVDSPFSCRWGGLSNWRVHADNLTTSGPKDGTTPICHSSNT